MAGLTLGKEKNKLYFVWGVDIKETVKFMRGLAHIRRWVTAPWGFVQNPGRSERGHF